MEDYKEKYEQAIFRMNKWVEGSEITDPKEVAEFVFPELKESEDERIRKICIHFLELQKTHHAATFEIDECIDWLEKQSKKTDTIENFDTEFEKQVSCLIASAINREHEYNQGYVKWTANALLEYAKHELEKQGEQKPADNNESKFKVGDWVVYEENIYQIHNISLKKYYECLRIDGTVHTFDFEYIDSKSRLWTIQDAKDGDVLCYRNDIFLVKSYVLFNRVVSHCTYSERFISHNIYSFTRADFSKIYPATKEQRDFLFSKMKEAGYKWDAEKKELKKIEQKNIEGTFINVDEVRENFVKEVYRVLANDTTNDRANDIIYYFDSLPTIYLHTNKHLPSDGDDFDMDDIFKNPVWSEEDERLCQRLIEEQENIRSSEIISDLKEMYSKRISWLKSLRQRMKGE
jgi:hypothetical protein